MNTPPPAASLPLTPNTLTLPKERTYFSLVLIFSILVWLLLAVSIIGLIYAAVFAAVFWLANGLMVARLRSEAVKVDERQMPELHALLREVCGRLGVAPVPALYVVQAGGTLNAFAARHAGRGFVVVFSDFLEALGPGSPELKFVLGHEIGHIKSKHILKQILLAPGLFLPLLGPAYRRSWESSCDRYGAYAAGDTDSAVRAMLTLGGGRERGRQLNAEVFASQHREERGFFVSLHELISTYPTLSKRVTDLLALKSAMPARRPARNPLAYFLAMFVPGGNTAAPANALIFIVIIGLLAAMAIPAFQKVHQSSIAMVCRNNLRQLSAASDQYVLETGHQPNEITELVGPDKYIKTMLVCPRGGTYELSPAEGQDAPRIVCTVHGSMEDLQQQFEKSRQK
ncbi:MAG: M48 family metalloprotease [Opitutaceae bacterium]|nr:M48 family metalloprotease [Opitutaceae bacterium]